MHLPVTLTRPRTAWRNEAYARETFCGKKPLEEYHYPILQKAIGMVTLYAGTFVWRMIWTTL